MKNNFRGNVGTNKLLNKYQKIFRIPEDVNYYLDKDYRNAGRKFIKNAFLSSKIKTFIPEHPIPQ